MATIQVESKFAHAYLEERSFLQVVECLEEELFKAHIDTIIKDLPQMIRDFPRSAETLRTLYEIIEQTDLITGLSKTFGAYISDTGLKILSNVKSTMNEKELASFVDQIIELKV